MKFLGKYMQIKKRDIGIAWKKAKMSKTCYLFLLPYFILFTVFYVLPVCMSVFYSFTYYNVLEPAKFIGVENYIDLLLNDDVFLIAVKNTFLLAAITGPLGYIMAFLFAWFINELPRFVRAFAVMVFYAPTISGQAYLIWSIRIFIEIWYYQRANPMADGYQVHDECSYYSSTLDESWYRIPFFRSRSAGYRCFAV